MGTDGVETDETYPMCPKCSTLNPQNATYCVNCGKRLSIPLDEWLEDMVKEWQKRINPHTKLIDSGAIHQTMKDIGGILAFFRKTAKLDPTSKTACEIAEKLKHIIDPYIKQYNNKPVKLLEAIQGLHQACVALGYIQQEVLTETMKFWADNLSKFTHGRVPNYEIGEGEKA